MSQYLNSFSFWRSFVLGVLLIFVVVQITFRTGYTLFTYPWYFPDSYDWIVNGLAYSGLAGQLDITHRALLLPLVIAALYRLNIVDFIVYYGTFFYACNVVLVFFFLRKISDTVVAGLCSLFFVFSFTITSQSAFVGSDVAACAMLYGAALSFLCFLKKDKFIYLYLTGIFLALGMHSQYIGVFFLPVAAVSLFLEDQQCNSSHNKLRVGLGRVRRLCLSRHLYGSVVLSFFTFLLLLLPRLLKYGIIYEERVSHASLIKWMYDGGVSHFLRSTLAAFSWPIIALAIIGIIVGLAKRQERFASVYFALFLLSIGGFFACMYSWKDPRFCIYISLPIFFFAAVGLDEALTLSGKILKHSRLVKPAEIIILVLPLYYVSSPLTTDFFDISFSATPWHGFAYDNGSGWVQKKLPSLPYLINHARENRERLSSIQNDDIDNDQVSEPLARFFSKFPNEILETVPGNLYFFQELAPHQPYYVRNRNIIYLRANINLISSKEHFWETIKSLPAALVLKESDIVNIPQRISTLPISITPVAKSEKYALIKLH